MVSSVSQGFPNFPMAFPIVTASCTAELVDTEDALEEIKGDASVAGTSI